MPNERLEPTLEQVTAEVPQTQETNVEADERAYEGTEASSETFLEKSAENVAAASAQPAKQTHVTEKAVEKDETLIRVEKNNGERSRFFLYDHASCGPSSVQEKGEETANEISAMIRNFKVKVGKVLKLIRDWLHTIPGVNRFFLEQEAKIKTDNILEMAGSYEGRFSKATMIALLLQADVFDESVAAAPFDFTSFLKDPIVMLVLVLLGIVLLVITSLFLIRRTF